jgi:hypothetical protein
MFKWYITSTAIVTSNDPIQRLTIMWNFPVQKLDSDSSRMFREVGGDISGL